MSNLNIGIYIIGDEILSGKREDKHLTQAIQILKAREMIVIDRLARKTQPSPSAKLLEQCVNRDVREIVLRLSEDAANLLGHSDHLIRTPVELHLFSNRIHVGTP